MKILMVCLGNICRSPLAHGIMEHLVAQENLPWQIDSAGTASYHIGSPPDRRSIAVANKYGIDISSQRARSFLRHDLETYDHIFVMDHQNMNNVAAEASTEKQKAKIKLLIPDQEVPDPYYDNDLFEPVFSMIKKRCEELVKALK